MVKGSFETLRRVVVDASVATTWTAAVNEWTVISLQEDPAGEGECVCGQQELVKLFTIRNEHNGVELFPIGSTCVEQFGRRDLNVQVDLFLQLHKLKALLLEGKRLELTSEQFSRALLAFLNDEGVFTPDQWNDGAGWVDYEFLLTMFNKKIKENITKAQQRKISVLLNRKIKPFILNDERLR